MAWCCACQPPASKRGRDLTWSRGGSSILARAEWAVKRVSVTNAKWAARANLICRSFGTPKIKLSFFPPNSQMSEDALACYVLFTMHASCCFLPFFQKGKKVNLYAANFLRIVLYAIPFNSPAFLFFPHALRHENSPWLEEEDTKSDAITYYTRTIWRGMGKLSLSSFKTCGGAAKS